MRMPGTCWFWATAAIFIIAAACLISSPAKAYEYQDDFSSDKAENDSNFHSIFWPQGAFPPRQAYLYFRDTTDERELGFGDYNDDPAYLCYRFPEGSENLTGSVYGELLIDVRRLESSGYLSYQTSADGVNWSIEVELPIGSQQETHEIHLESVRGSCYVKFSGTGVLIDNLQVNLHTPSATILVPEDFATIQEAIDNANEGDIIEVGPGTYRGEGNWDIDFRGKAITVRSSAGPDDTIIKCTGSEGHRGFYFHAYEGPDSVLRGFKIIGATIPGSDVPPDRNWISSPVNPVGGGIFCEFSSPSIVDCIIKECAAEMGGGIGVVNGSPIIIDCVIEDCQAGGFGQATSGGRGAGIAFSSNSDAIMLHSQIKNNSGYYNTLGSGIYCWRSSVFFSYCYISNNSAQGSIRGGGAFCGGSSSHTIEFENCVISNNTAEIGGGICAGYPGDIVVENVVITNCTIAHNSLSVNPSDPSVGGGIHSVSSDITIRNSIVWSNHGVPIMLVDTASSSPVLYSCVEGGYPGQGNIDSDPLFVSPGSSYHLKSSLGHYDPWSRRWIKDDGYYSPCIDAGDPLDSYIPEPLTNGKRINMGAYGGTAEASKGEEGLILHVDKDTGSDYSNEGLSRTDAFASIQKAVDEAYPGDTILVWPGTYREDVNLLGKAITLQSADEAAVVTASNAFAFTFQMGEGSNCVLRNFIITGCNTTDGGAIYLNASSPTLANLTITGNRQGISAWGGAIPDIVNCILWNNTEGDLAHCKANYSCIEEEKAGNVGIGNISTDPMFADPGSGDFHLMSRHGRYSPINGTWLTDSLSSPCIDAGDPGMVPGRELKPHGGRINMGAYGGTPFASLSGQ